MNYTNEKEQIVFLKDADIANNLEGKTISSEAITTNGIPSFDLFKKTYEELSTYDNNMCAYIKDGIEISVQNLCTEISILREETDELSTNICTSVDYISGFVRDTISADLYELSAGTKETSTLLSNQITAIWNDIRGGINYKGHMSANYTTTFTDGSQYDISTLFASYYSLLDDATKELTADKKLNNGWLYNFTTTDLSGYRTKDGTLLENNDYLIIHNHSASCINVSEITRETVDIIEAIQSDYVRFALLEKISSALSIDYIKKIGELSGALSGVTRLSVENLQEQIISNDNDIEYLSDAISVEIKRNLDSVHRKKDIVVNAEDHTIITTLKRTFGDVYDIRVGYLTRFPIAHTITNEAGTWSYDFEENDFILFKKNCTADTADETCFDIIKDYDKEIERTYSSLCSQIFDVSTFISNDVTYLSGFVKDTISADLYALSNELCGVSTDICISANQISNALSTLSVNLSTDLSNVEYHYNKTFTEQKYTKGGEDLDVDVLNVVDSEDLERKFVLVYLSGTLVLSSI